jgi:hypothetical protein
MSDVDALVAVLDAATDDTERATLLAAASEGMRRKLRVRLGYLRFIEETDRKVQDDRRRYAGFTEALEAAPDDAARLAIVRPTDPKFLAEWRWHQTATEDSRRKRYLALTA